MPPSRHPSRPASAMPAPAHTWQPTFGRAARERALPALAPEPDRVPVLGIPLALIDYERTMDWIDAAVARDERHYLSAAAVHLVMVCQEDPEVRDAVLGCSLTLPDGQPLVWALRALNHDASRVYGPELMARYCERSAETGTRMYLYGGRRQESGAAAAR